ncbi:hypothetical protein B0H13DRAFT_2415726 [Mycena leptocephala]|nr:hypothetical protein B0H13DRAFT_2415726 [Mycena leptocephala]
MHASPPNLVPTISLSALPQTPASEWADSMNDLISAHVTLTPGPTVPGSLPSHLESKQDSTYISEAEPTHAHVEQQKQPKEETRIASAHAHTTLATVKAYLRAFLLALYYQINADLIHSKASSEPVSRPSLPSVAFSAVSVSPPSTRQGTMESTTVNIGHTPCVPYSGSAPDAYHAEAEASAFSSPGARSPALSTDPGLPSDSEPALFRGDPPRRHDSVMGALSTAVHTGHSSTELASPSSPAPASSGDQDLLSELSLEFTERPPLRRDSTPLSTTAHTGHRSSSAVPPPSAVPSPPAPAFSPQGTSTPMRRDSTALSTTVHTGHRDSSSAVPPPPPPPSSAVPASSTVPASSPPPPAFSPQTTSGPMRFSQEAQFRTRFAPDAQLVQSPSQLSPLGDADPHPHPHPVADEAPHRCPLKCAAAECTHRVVAKADAHANWIWGKSEGSTASRIFPSIGPSSARTPCSCRRRHRVACIPRRARTIRPALQRHIPPSLPLSVPPTSRVLNGPLHTSPGSTMPPLVHTTLSPPLPRSPRLYMRLSVRLALPPVLLPLPSLCPPLRAFSMSHGRHKPRPTPPLARTCIPPPPSAPLSPALPSDSDFACQRMRMRLALPVPFAEKGNFKKFCSTVGVGACIGMRATCATPPAARYGTDVGVVGVMDDACPKLRALSG